tara:strand:+ start:8500 stop:9093 length:594 start_codon:yes stop_codon:yes gene_type:complete
MTTLDHINIENNSIDDVLVFDNFTLFEEIVLKKGYKKRILTDTENMHFHRYRETDMYDSKVLDHHRNYLTSDGKKIQVCSLYRCEMNQKHDMLVNDGWVVIKPIYSTRARTYMRFVNIDIMRLQIKEEILKKKMTYYKDSLNWYIEQISTNGVEKKLERAQNMIHKTYAELEDVYRKIGLLMADEHKVDISRLIINV